MEKESITISGTYSSRFEPLCELFASKLETSEELGASLAVSIDGEMVVDVWGGWADEARTVPWGENTITNVFSTTKTMTSLAALVLIDRGELNLESKVASYWPEFAAQNKSEITVRQLLTHSSGVSGWDQPVAIQDLYDWEKSTSMLAAQAPWWKPGTCSGYHALSYGHLIGEVIRRITGQRLGEFFASQIASPLDADFHIGLPSSEFHRVSNVVPFPSLPIDMSQLDPNSVVYKTLNGPRNNPESSWTTGWRSADIGAANGHGNARSVARIQSVVACGGEVNDVRIVSSKTLSQIFEVQSFASDLVLGIPLKLGVGYGLPWQEVLPGVPQGRVCFGAGAGGSLVIADSDRRMTIAFVMNKLANCMIVGPNALDLIKAAYSILEE